MMRCRHCSRSVIQLGGSESSHGTVVLLLAEAVGDAAGEPLGAHGGFFHASLSTSSLEMLCITSREPKTSGVKRHGERPMPETLSVSTAAALREREPTRP